MFAEFLHVEITVLLEPVLMAVETHLCMVEAREDQAAYDGAHYTIRARVTGNAGNEGPDHIKSSRLGGTRASSCLP